MDNLAHSPAWQNLLAHYHEIRHFSMRDLFLLDEKRMATFSLDACGMTLDYSRNRINTITMQRLSTLAKQQQLAEKRESVYPAHWRIRNDEKIRQMLLERLKQLSSSKQSFTDIVNVGIGGSAMGARLLMTALKSYADPQRKIHFLTNISSDTFQTLIQSLDLKKTLFVIASKTFLTKETLTHANQIKTLYTPTAFQAHCMAITAYPERDIEFGIAEENILSMDPDLSGRYSIWGEMAFPAVLGLGLPVFEQLHQGAREMDHHFFTAPDTENIPVILALLSIWYTNFFSRQTQAVIPYDEVLAYFVDYLQQLHMESCGKSVTLSGNTVEYETSPVIWGGLGCVGQHSFYQLLHQGTVWSPIDFIISMSHTDQIKSYRQLLVANCIAQANALMLGEGGKVFGNRPSNVILLPDISPFVLGALIAAYEHKVFSQSVIWDINPYDQKGVDFGKLLAEEILLQTAMSI